jgi:hypothetical protein
LIVALPHPIRGTTYPETVKSPSWLRIAFWISIAIAVAAVLRRLVALAAPAGNAPPQLAALDDVFASHAALTLSHIIPALLFVLVAPFVVFRRAHPIPAVQRAFYLLGAIVGLTAYAMSMYSSVGGWIERSAILLFDTLFLFSLTRAYLYRGQPDSQLERRWQLRSIAVLLGIATARPVMGIFFATAHLTHLVPAQFFGIAMWIGFSVNVLVFELWIRSATQARQRSQSQIPSAPLRSEP